MYWDWKGGVGGVEDMVCWGWWFDYLLVVLLFACGGEVILGLRGGEEGADRDEV